ncbi:MULTISPECIES: S8 family peptidase [unclassified Pseudoxanthomonas]|uniref:S8 family peptidase n=1 Tax=unclassified Pseudoxanthomonas TaxID=2645906 RepID=UPI0008E0076E|nr:MULTISPECIES: S8 family peptidase [unclassified Pseudoxanthomonas]PPJ41746.1 peptidase S8 [Pseudoxanthomonas sp. KAs_5_3]SFV29821.1 serine protease [Pseudoxanthomonas sp. YR558]
MNPHSSFRNSRRRPLVAALAAIVALGAFAGSASAGDVSTAGLRDGQTYDRFIVKYRDGSAARANSATLQRSLLGAVSRSALGAANGKAVSAAKLRRLGIGADLVQTSRKLDRVEAESLLRQLATDPDVEFVEVDARRYARLVPNDTYYNQYQWHFKDPVGGINLPTAWDSATGAGVVVAVLDTGITTHSDLDANIHPGYDFISDTFVSRDGDGRDANPRDEGDWNPVASECYTGSPVQDSSWHGTHVAGTVAEVTNNAKGMAGGAFNAKVVPARVLGRCGGYTSDISDAVIWASGGTVAGVPANANPAEVINLSLGGSGACSAVEQNAFNIAIANGSTVVVAAGNDAGNVSGYSPGNCAGVITVGATRITGGIASYSNYGARIDISAPGGGGSVDGNPGGYVWSTGNAGTTVPTTETYFGMGGTSMAAPHVAAVVALMQSVAETPLTPAQILATLKSTARPFPVAPPANRPIGAGIVNAAAAVQAVIGGGEPPTATVLTNNVAVGGNMGAKDAVVQYALVVPAGATNLSFISYGGTGNADVYVKFGSAATATNYDLRSARPGNNEVVNIAAPQAGTYYVSLVGKTKFANVSVRGGFTSP